MSKVNGEYLQQGKPVCIEDGLKFGEYTDKYRKVLLLPALAYRTR